MFHIIPFFCWSIFSYLYRFFYLNLLLSLIAILALPSTRGWPFLLSDWFWSHLYFISTIGYFGALVNLHTVCSSYTLLKLCHYDFSLIIWIDCSIVPFIFSTSCCIRVYIMVEFYGILYDNWVGGCLSCNSH